MMKLKRRCELNEDYDSLMRWNPLKEATPAKKTVTKNEKLVLDSWKSLSNKTKVFETIPLLFAISSKPQLKADEMIALLNRNFDWDSQGKEWLLKLLTKIKGDKEAFDVFNKIVVAGTINPNAQSLKELNGNKIVTGFIHGSINKFYAKLKSSTNYNPASKQFTADVVLLWGPGTAYDVMNGDLLKKITPTEESLSLLSDKKTLMACVSLKALEGRVGKITSLFQDKFGEKSIKSEEFVSEGVFDMLQKGGSKFVQGFKNLVTKFTDWAKNTWETITGIFSPRSPEVIESKKENEEQVSDAEEVLSSFDQELEEHYTLRGQPLTEASEDEPIQVSSCFRKQVLSWYSKFENDTKKINKAFQEFQKNTSQYSTTNYFRLSFTSLDEKNREFQNELKRVRLMVDKIKRANEQPGSSKRASCLLLTDGNEPLTFTRKELKNILMSNSNFISISLLNSMIDNLLAKSKSLKSKEALANLIKFSTELNAEAIFGAATEIPLIKYDGVQIIKFGSRKNYEEEHKSKMMDYFKSVKTLPVIGIKIYPPKSKNTVTYYVILMYSLADYKGTDSVKPSDKDFVYNAIAFKCNSGSDFAFAVESDTTLTGDKIAKALASDTEQI